MTADRTYVLFTREVGLVYARAVSVRREQSKLRYNLQNFSRARISLVRGKQGWRIVGAEQGVNLYFTSRTRDARAALLHALKLLRRFVRGEEAHRTLYDTFVADLTTVCACDAEQSGRAAQLLVLRMLALLGYVAPHAAYERALSAPALEHVLLDDGAPDHRAVRSAIDRALSVSHL